VAPVPQRRAVAVALHAEALKLMAAGPAVMRWVVAVEPRSLRAAWGAEAVEPLGAPPMEWVAAVAVQAPQLQALSACLRTAAEAVAALRALSAGLQTAAEAVVPLARNGCSKVVEAEQPRASATAAWEADHQAGPRGDRFLNRLLVVAARANREASYCARAHHREQRLQAVVPALCS
jgi:hypothetical protein